VIYARPEGQSKKLPWKQRLGLHRKFNLWAFLDNNGRAYDNLPMALRIFDGQRSLFE